MLVNVGIFCQNDCQNCPEVLSLERCRSESILDLEICCEMNIFDCKNRLRALRQPRARAVEVAEAGTDGLVNEPRNLTERLLAVKYGF